MILYLGASNGTWQPINIPAEYPIPDVIALLPELWWGPGKPVWVASDNADLAKAAANFYSVPVQDPPAIQATS